MSITTQIKRDRTNILLKKSHCQRLVGDELTEALICQRVKDLENNLFDEYWDELLAYRKQVGASR